MVQKVHITTDPVLKKIVSCMGYIELCKGDSLDNWFGLFPNGSSILFLPRNFSRNVSF